MEIKTTMSQAYCFLASELALKAQAQADRLGSLQERFAKSLYHEGNLINAKV
jgi:hypothetical protein